jgi:hypothetical protein
MKLNWITNIVFLQNQFACRISFSSKLIHNLRFKRKPSRPIFTPIFLKTESSLFQTIKAIFVPADRLIAVPIRWERGKSGHHRVA